MSLVSLVSCTVLHVQSNFPWVSTFELSFRVFVVGLMHDFLIEIQTASQKQVRMYGGPFLRFSTQRFVSQHSHLTWILSKLFVLYHTHILQDEFPNSFGHIALSNSFEDL